MRNLRIAELLFNQPLMISEAKLNTILHAMGPRFNVDISSLPMEKAEFLSDQERRRAGYSVVDGVAKIGVHGPLLHRLLASEYPSGGPTTYADIRSSFDTALADDGVTSIVFDIDSPGGMVSGAFDLADHIYQSRGIKPSTAIVDESAFSSGYLLACSAGRIILPRTANVGSVGVIATHADFSRAEDKAGITVTHIYAGARKADGSPHMPISAEAFAEIQSSVNDTYSLFVETVARNRGLTTEQVRSTEAGIFKARQAISNGFADEIATVTSAMKTARKTNRSTIFTASAAPIGKETHTMNLEQLKQEHPDLCAALIEEGKQSATADIATAIEAARQEGATAERQRIRDIEEACSGRGHDKLVASLKFDGTTTAGMAAIQVLGADKQLSAGALASMNAEANPAVDPADNGETEGGEVPETDGSEESAKKAWDKSADLRAEFGGNFKAYHAYTRNAASGRARILHK